MHSLIKKTVSIKAGEKIGFAQDLHMTVSDKAGPRPADPLNVEQHVHVTIKDSQGRFISPDGKVIVIMKKGQVPVKMSVSP